METVFNILLVEDNPADVRLTREALTNGKIIHQLYVVQDGEEAINFLREGLAQDTTKPRPDLILLDLNLPKKNGKEVLAEIKADPDLHTIPVVILTTSQADEDILSTYDMHANGYIVKPVDLDQFFAAIKKLEEFWMSVVLLPPNPKK